MFARIFVFLIGFGLTVIGFVYMISYLNLLSLGYNFLEYVQFIVRRLECMYSVIGILIIVLDLYIPGGKHELYL
ncbi:MAG: hypothetical protein MR388_01765 [Tenericutes bacterium]|nr:hypothetical protein [Mycoplasmatota bacterium]